jgi:hypothetical protein
MHLEESRILDISLAFGGIIMTIEIQEEES